MFFKIINILSKPHLIPHKIINFIRFNKLKKEYDFKKYEEKQNNKFNELDLDRKRGILNLNELKKKILL